MTINDTDTDTLRRVLRNSHTIAVVGLSAEPDRPSYRVAKYLQAHGYRIVPVNPKHPEILGEKSYPDLASIPFAVDMVDVFRKAQDCVPVAQQAVAIGAKVLWLQLGVVNDEAQQVAQAAGLTVVMDRCVKIDHANLL
ncbi:MAG: CoA-binding protein [Rhodoferax sp.]|nr:CoA-binding protein [Rhodoferax sp.]NCP55733.1 CoA-binding protein [Rhodoferax sp.]PIY25503.1 MAG: CoA-binding protein [Comamonadaceae bacterium CG_4_10_14_3_um_filter_60_75]